MRHDGSEHVSSVRPWHPASPEATTWVLPSRAPSPSSLSTRAAYPHVDVTFHALHAAESTSHCASSHQPHEMEDTLAHASGVTTHVCAYSQIQFSMVIHRMSAPQVKDPTTLESSADSASAELLSKGP